MSERRGEPKIPNPAHQPRSGKSGRDEEPSPEPDDNSELARRRRRELERLFAS